jgi:hypothetical protein
MGLTNIPRGSCARTMDSHFDIPATSHRRAVVALKALFRFGILYELL